MKRIKIFISSVQKLHTPHKSLPANPQLADPMYWNGYIEKVGTGTEDIINKCREYGLKTPEFYQEEDFRVVIWRVNDERKATTCQSVPERTRRSYRVIKLDKRKSKHFKNRTFYTIKNRSSLNTKH